MSLQCNMSTEATPTSSCLVDDDKAERARIKKLKKEEGRKRAIEIAQQRQRQQRQQQQLLRDGEDIREEGGIRQSSSRRSGRHGARNQHRHKFMCKWIMDTFPHLTEQTGIEEPHKVHVLDVAGGKGELAARLSMCHNQSVVLIDPRRADVASCFLSLVLPKLPNKWQRRIHDQVERNQNFVKDRIQERVEQLVMNFDQGAVEQSPELQAAVQECSLIVGLHADGATEAIVDVALKYQKPFVVVPCCVFPRLFHQRYLTREDGKKVQVRSHEQFCQYLLEKDERFIQAFLPFEGRNVGIYWDGMP